MSKARIEVFPERAGRIQRQQNGRPTVVHDEPTGQWRVRLVASNNRKLMVSEAYTSNGHAWRAARTIWSSMQGTGVPIVEVPR